MHGGLILLLCGGASGFAVQPGSRAAAAVASSQQHSRVTDTATRRRVTASPRAAADLGPEHDEKVAKALKAMVGFSNSYCKNTGTTYCSDPSIPAVVIKGLAEHKVLLGAPLCPCRHYEDKEAEAKDGYWNCPCVPMRERHECHCMCAAPPLPACHARRPRCPHAHGGGHALGSQALPHRR